MSRGRGGRRPFAWASVGLALCAAVAVPAALLSAALAGPVAEPIQVPVQGSFRVQGHGFGHGRGMSQWGAQGAAVSGIDYRTIMDTYYPGTTLSRASAEERVRVLLSAAGADGLEVRAGPGLAAVTEARSVRLPATLAGVRVTRWRVRTEAGRLHLAGWTGVWRGFDPGAGQWDGTWLALRSPEAVPLWLLQRTAEVAYRGSIRIVPGPADPAVQVVDELGLEDYLRSVVPAETPANWAPDALRAQAVAARTFAAWHAARSGEAPFDVCDSTSCQVYPGAARRAGPGRPVETLEDPRTDAAIAATAREELLYQGAPALAEYSDSNGGWSAAGNRPYLPARPDPWDGLVPNAVHSWEAAVPAARIAALWPGLGRVVGLGVRARDGHGDWGGRVLEVLVVGEEGERVVPGRRFALAVGLRQSWWRFQSLGGSATPSPTPTLPTIPPLLATAPPGD